MDKIGRSYFVNHEELICPICKNNNFWTKETLMNTRGATFMEMEWLNESATNFICSNCSHIITFYSTDHIHQTKDIENPASEKIQIDQPTTSSNGLVIFWSLAIIVPLIIIIILMNLN